MINHSQRMQYVTWVGSLVVLISTIPLVGCNPAPINSTQPARATATFTPLAATLTATPIPTPTLIPDIDQLIIAEEIYIKAAGVEYIMVEEKIGPYKVWVYDSMTNKVSVVYEHSEGLTDAEIHWSMDGEAIGLISDISLGNYIEVAVINLVTEKAQLLKFSMPFRHGQILVGPVLLSESKSWVAASVIKVVTYPENVADEIVSIISNLDGSIQIVLEGNKEFVSWSRNNDNQFYYIDHSKGKLTIAHIEENRYIDDNYLDVMGDYFPERGTDIFLGLNVNSGLILSKYQKYVSYINFDEIAWIPIAYKEFRGYSKPAISPDGIWVLIADDNLSFWNIRDINIIEKKKINIPWKWGFFDVGWNKNNFFLVEVREDNKVYAISPYYPNEQVSILELPLIGSPTFGPWYFWVSPNN